MIFSNFTIFSVLFISIILFFGVFFLLSDIKKKKKIQKIGLLFIFISFFCVLVTLLGPKGGVKDTKLETKGLNIAFVLDVSKSMDALDEYKDSRLNRSKIFINNFVRNNPENKYSLTIFSGEALKIIPFTFDLNIFSTFLNGVNEKNLSKQGTNIEEAINIGLSNFLDIDTKGGVLVLVTDGGEESIEDYSLIKRKLEDKQLKLIILGVGSLKGSFIPSGVNFFGKLSYKVHNGELVKTKLEEKELKKISNKLNGLYFRLDEKSKSNDKILGSIDKVKLEKNIKNRVDLTRFLILIAFIFWIGFLLTL